MREQDASLGAVPWNEVTKSGEKLDPVAEVLLGPVN